ncbi:GOLPH3/VPS74 family protein [Streptomyces sp. ID01-9D]|uniref:GOLPH3/VPS74 family protein n=1 Tax=Streptomyces sp. ID01-9D TaxID=3028659 RepID=UPI0029C5549B|nr:GPP34 family phosphoprotein [Streptomyces sp. ID01-9D]MDX5576986.1 GPP34 family phosphoprotein [Streptomyces sp. ID01-9D]
MTHDAPELTLPEELILLTLDPLRGKPLCDRTHLRYGTAGAVLAELELQGRISEKRGRVQVVNPLDPAHPLLASLLRTLNPPSKSRFRSGTSAKAWIRQYGRDAEERHLDTLIERGLLRRETRRFLGVLPYQRHFPADPDLTGAARRRFGQAEALGFPDRRNRALAALISAIGLAGTLSPDGSAGHTTMKAIRRTQWAATAVHHNVRQTRSSGGDSGGGGGWSDGGLGESDGGSSCGGSSCGGGGD